METEFLGSRKAKLWTYLVLGGLLVGAVVIANVALVNPELARQGVDAFLGLPSWVFAVLAALVGAVIYWFGIHVEADWPEFLGATMIAGSVLAAQILIGWDHFEIGGLTAIPFVIPPVVFIGLMIYGMIKSP